MSSASFNDHGENFLRSLVPVVVLLVCYFALGLSASTRKSVTGDEGTHLVGGYSYWTLNDYRLNPESGNWAQRWAALPVWLAGYKFPALDDSSWQDHSEYELALQFLFRSGNDPDRMLLLGRMMIGLWGVALGLIVYFWSRQLFGPIGGLVSLTLYAFSPTMLTHGFLAMADLSLTFFMTASVGAVWRLLHRITPGRIAICCVALTGLFLSKVSSAAVAPMIVLLIGIRTINPAPLVMALRKTHEIVGRWRMLAASVAAMLVVAIGVWMLIWISYGLRYSMYNPVYHRQTSAEMFAGDDLISNMGRFAEQHHLLPEAFLYAYSYMLGRTQGSSAFYNGEFGTRGWLTFFPYAVAVKTSLSMFVVLAFAAAASWHFRRRDSVAALPKDAKNRNRQAKISAPSAISESWLYKLSPLLVLLGVFWIFALTSHFNIGHRHVLATYPPMFILAGAAGWWFQPAGAAGWIACSRAVVVLALVLAAVEAICIWPNYLAYFNLLIGGPSNGYKHLVDSSLDWSQDAKELKRWFDAHPADVLPPQRVYISFFGNAPLDYYGIDAIRLPSFTSPWTPNIAEPLHGGTYCISATELDNVLLVNCQGRWNKKYEETYQILRKNVDSYRRSLSDPELRARILKFAGEDQWKQMIRMFEQLRFSRLCSYLRQRVPDDEVGHSILIYRLTDADVEQAVNGPPVELLEKPEGSNS